MADQVHFNHPYTDLELNPEGARVRFADGSSASADYVLAADGSQSLARQRHIDPRPLREAKQIWSKFLKDQPDSPVLRGTIKRLTGSETL